MGGFGASFVKRSMVLEMGTSCSSLEHVREIAYLLNFWHILINRWRAIPTPVETAYCTTSSNGSRWDRNNWVLGVGVVLQVTQKTAFMRGWQFSKSKYQLDLFVAQSMWRCMKWDVLRITLNITMHSRIVEWKISSYKLGNNNFSVLGWCT